MGPVTGFGSDQTIADHVLLAVSPYVSADLISEAAREDVLAIARCLPAALSDFFGFECALGDDRPIADLLVCCRARHGSLERLAEGGPADRFPVALRHSPVWQRIRAMATEWMRPGSVLRDEIHNLWLEFDIDGERGPALDPNVFVGSYRLGGGGVQHDGAAVARSCAWLTDLALPILSGREVAPGDRRQIIQCLQALAPRARLFQVGLMLARDVPTTRLCARGLTSGEIVAYLDRIEWPGALHCLARLLGSLDRLVQRVDLDLDVDQRVLPKVGLECYLDLTAGGTHLFIDYLLSTRLCTQQKGKAVASWPGSIFYEFGGPVRSSEGSTEQSGTASCGVFLRRLHHIKLTFEAAAPVSAKAYLGVHHREAPGSRQIDTGTGPCLPGSEVSTPWW